MGLLFSSIETQFSMASTASSHSSNTALNYTSHIAHVDVYCQKATTTASSNLVMVQKISNININTQGGTPEISIQAQDLLDFDISAWGYAPYITAASSTDEALEAISLPYYFSPYPEDPTEPYGIQPLQMNQFVVNWIADVSHTFDNYVYDLYFEGVNPKATNGYIVANQDKETMVVGSPTWTKAFGKVLLGVFYGNGGTFIDDVAADGAYNVTAVRTNAVTNSRNIIFGPFTPMRATAINRWPMSSPVSQTLLDDGDLFMNYGMFNNTGNGGININGQSNIEIQTVGGTTDVITIYPIVLR